MTSFIVGAALLSILLAAIVLRSGGKLREADLDDPNLQWYRLRKAEIQGDNAQQLLDEAQLRLLEEGVDGSMPTAPPAQGRPSRAVALGLFSILLLAALAIYSQLGAYQDVLVYREIEAFDPAVEGGLGKLAERIAQRSAARPDNFQYLGLLGQLQLAEEDFSGAARTHTRLAELAPNDASAQAQAVQSRFMAAGRVLDAQSQLFAERALALDPQQASALGLLGMASFEQGQFSAAVSYWERLQALEAPGSQGYELLENVILAAKARGGSSNQSVAAAGGDDTDADVGAGVTVSLALAAPADVAANAAVFVFARRADAASGMPIAVRRLRAGELPITLRLSDADSMAGQQLSGAGEVVVSAQLSRNGQPGDANASHAGRSVPVVAGDKSVAVQIELVSLGAES